MDVIPIDYHEQMQLLKSMGFNDEEEIKNALIISKNDINEAVSILTNEKLTKITSINTNSNEIVMNESSSGSPSSNGNSTNNLKETAGLENPLIFPYEVLLQFENSVFTENWSIPYKKDELLDILLTSSKNLLSEGIADSNPDCKRFLDRVIPETFQKLFDSQPVNKWSLEIQEGVYKITFSFIELVCMRLSQAGVPDILLNSLNLIFNPDCNFHNKNQIKQMDREILVQCFNKNQILFSKNVDRYGWLADYINHFGINKGFDSVIKHIESTNDLHELNCLLKPFATCIDILNEEYFKSHFNESFIRILKLIENLESDDFKDKNAGKVFELLQTMKKICASFWTPDVDTFHSLHLIVALNMLKNPHFNSKMNSLKEICKLIESSKNFSCRVSIRENVLADWIVNSRILSLAVEGNIDQSQYCDKIKSIVEFIGDRINNEEISVLWNMQFNKSMSLVDNLYVIIGIAATKFNSEQLDYLLTQIGITWNDSSFKLHDKLVGLLRIIGREAKTNKTYARILEALWDLRNRPGLTRHLLLLIYNEHLNVLNGGRLPRENSKSLYLAKCCDDLKKAPGSTLAFGSLKQMLDILNSFQRNSTKSLKEAVTDIVKPVMKDICISLIKCHSNAYERAKIKNQIFDQNTLSDDIFTHEEIVRTHLNLIKFVLQEGSLYLFLTRAQTIWDILINNEHSCDWDKQIGFEWFIDCIMDLNDASKLEIFKKNILSLQVNNLSLKGYECFRLYFLKINELESKLQVRAFSDSENFTIEKLELTGLNFLWDVILYNNDEAIANLATKFLLEILYEKLSLKLKREIVQLHQKFINECYARLENCLITLDSSPISQLLLNAFRISYASVSLNELNSVPIAPRSEILKCIERLLMVAEKYIITVEENSSISRSNLPHFLTFKSESFSLKINCENRAPIDLFVCSNETLGELRQRVSSMLNIQPNNSQFYYKDKLLSQSNDIKLLNNLKIDGTEPLSVKIISTYPSSLNQTPVKDSTSYLMYTNRVDNELEKSFPGVLISTNNSAFEMLNRLEDFDEPKIRTRVRNITKLIPTNPRLLEAFDNIIGKIIINSSLSQTPSRASAAASSTLAAANVKAFSLTRSPSSSSVNIQSTNSLTSQNQLSMNSTHSLPLTSSSVPSTPTTSSFLANQSLISNQINSNENNSNSATFTSSVKNTAVAAVTSLFGSKKNESSSSTLTTSQCNSNSSNFKSFLKFFDKSLPLYRILYHLEALSSKIMPSSQDQVAQHNADLFLQDFLKANGLEVLVSLLKLDAPMENTKSNDYETKQDFYILLLQLLRLILFGSYYPLNPTVQNNICCLPHSHNSIKRPSNEPITTCAKKTITPAMISNQMLNQNLVQNSSLNNSLNSNQTSNADTTLNSLGNLEDKSSNIIQKMTINEIIEIISQLLNILWSAAAGNLQLNYNLMSLANSTESIVNNKRTVSNSSSSTSSIVGATSKNIPTCSSNILLIPVNSVNQSPISNISSTSTITSTSANEIANNKVSTSIAQQDASNVKQNLTSSSKTQLRVDDNIDIEECLDNIDINHSAKSIQKEVKFFIPDHRLSTGSNMSTSSVDSSDTQSQISQNQLSPSTSASLYSGICIKQKLVTTKDIKIASKAIEMISCFVQYRKDCLSTLLNMKFFNECVIDVLTGSISNEIRLYMKNFLLKLSQIETSNVKCKDYLIGLIIKARLPLWVNSSLTRSSSQRLISQSSQYFNLRCNLLENLTIEEQSAYSIDLAKMLNDEVNWFTSFTPTKSLKDIDNILLTGHLDLTRSLLTCETANKADIGEEIINQLIHTYLFPASYLIHYPSEDTAMEPICSSESSRLAAYKLLVELARNCIKNFRKICEKLILFHHSSNHSLINEWNVIPLVTPRAECGYVGLKNGGATCYMNAVLQQLFMIPSITNYLLAIDDESEKNNVFWQLQNVFAHLKNSKLEYYIPEPFWKAFRMWGQEVNLREQQDAFDFFISMTDQIDEHLKKSNKEPIFKTVFEGTFSNQFICKDCPHKYEREEAFLGLNLPVKSGNLQESLSQFVKDELLDGENSYYCEKCNEKRSAIKRTCIKKLPKYLCIQLKRFDYDWESNRSLKFDDFFEFPRQINVSPYMYDSINKVRDTNEDETQTSKFTKQKSKLDDKEISFELVGIVVHSGQANAGHYYSFVKGPKNSNNVTIDQELYELEQLNNSIDENCDANNSFNKPNKNQNIEPDKWYKFNDTTVEEINLSDDQKLMEECFGGTFTQTSENKMMPEERIRYWNGYMLFYKEPTSNVYTVQQRQTIKAAINENNKLKLMQRKEILSSSAYKISKDSLSELAELVTRGDEKGLFGTGLPPGIEQIVKAENLEFCKNKAVYCCDYFKFIFNLVKIFKQNSLMGEHRLRENDLFIVESCNLGLEFLYNTYFKTGKKLREDLHDWNDLFKELLYSSKEGGVTMLNFFVKYEANSSFIRHFLLECSIIEIREICGIFFENCFTSLIVKYEFQPLNNPKINNLVTSLVQLLDKSVIDLCKNSHEYFRFLYVYANMTKEACQQLISLGLFNKLLCFLLGNPGTIKTEESSNNRRWSSVQSREFGIIHELIASLVLKCKILSLKTCELPQQTKEMNSETNDEIINDLMEQQNHHQSSSNDTTLDYQPKSDNFKFMAPVDSTDLLPIPQEMQIYLFGALSNRYLKELVYAFEQINHNNLTKTLDMILSCCYCNESFSSNMIHQILLHINNSSSNEIKQALSLLHHIILIEDSLQLTRFRLAIDGYKDNNVFYNGLLSIIRQNQSSDSKKSYQCVKFIVSLASKTGTCKEYLLKTANNWEWSVNWLKTKMSDSSISASYVNWNSSKFQSNEDSEIKTFQRTKSAQRTLDDATALLNSTSATEFEV